MTQSHEGKKLNGFTLVEVVVVAGLIVFMTGILIRNFSTSRLYLQEATNIVLADIRNMQQRSITGANYPDPVGVPVARCGYGVSRASATSYRLYVAPPPHIMVQNNFCVALDKNYTTSGNPSWVVDTLITTKILPYTNLEFKTAFSDIFFEPPEPTIYTNNNSALNAAPSIITIGRVGQACTGSNCRTICIYNSGAINVGSGAACP